MKVNFFLLDSYVQTDYIYIKDNEVSPGKIISSLGGYYSAITFVMKILMY
jgi:hypothetical protein